VNKDRIGSIGGCMGGGYALDVALQEPTLAATVINYGHLATDPEDVKKFEAALKQAGKSADLKIYPDAGHAFENPNN